MLFNEELTHVSIFQAIPRGRRPRVRCPECDLEVTLHLGPERAHHFAHPPGARCIVTQPETALHFNAKFHIAKELREAAARGATLTLAVSCVAGVRPLGAREKPSDVPWHEWHAGRCGKSRSQAWDVVWDEVKLEQRLGSLESRRQPDVLLLRDGHPVAAIEIFATHAVDDEKAVILASLGLPWVEVVAADVLQTQEGPPGQAASPALGQSNWNAFQPLPVFRESAARRWRCPTHQTSYDAWLEDLRQERLEAERRAERARHSVRLVALRIVDAMYPSGKHYRHLYRVEERSTDDSPHTIALMLDDKVLLELRVGSGSKQAQWQAIKRRCNEDTNWVRDHSIAVDSPMSPGKEWLRGPVAERAWARAGLRPDKPFRYPLGYHFPLRYRFSREKHHWFIPPDLISVKWDREPGDDFSRHPASQRQPARAAVRARLRSGRDRSSGQTSTFGGRLTPAELGVPIDRVVERVTCRIFGVAQHDDPSKIRLAIVVPCGRAYADEVARVDTELAFNGFLRLWISPPADWSRQIAGIPWCPVGRDSSMRLVPPASSGYESLPALIHALVRGDLTPTEIAEWDARSGLSN